MKLSIHFTALGSTVDATLAEARRKADVAADGRLYDLEITDITEKALYGDGRTALWEADVTVTFREFEISNSELPRWWHGGTVPPPREAFVGPIHAYGGPWTGIHSHGHVDGWGYCTCDCGWETINYPPNLGMGIDHHLAHDCPLRKTNA